MSYIPIDDLHEVFDGREYRPIPGLHPGEKVRWRSKAFKDNNIPALDEVITVHRVFVPGANGYIGFQAGYCDQLDFSALFFDDDGDVVEFAFDSRRFERVESPVDKGPA